MLHAPSTVAHAPEMDAVRSLIRRLEQIRLTIDDKFVAACEILPASLAGISGLIGSLDQLTTTFDAEVMASTSAELTVAAAKLYSLPACHAHQAEVIARLDRSSEKLARHVHVIRCSLIFMDAIIDGARQEGQASAAVAQLTDRIAEQFAQSNTELHAFEDELATLKRDLAQASLQGKIRGRKMADLLPSVPDDLTAATRLLAAHYRAVAATAQQVAAVAHTIHDRLERLLTSLQIGDITRQRIEHILACVDRIEADAALQPPARRPRFAATCYALIARHLAQIAECFLSQTAAIECQMAEMADDAAALLKLHGLAFDRHPGSNRGFLRTLAARLNTAIGLVAPVEAADQTALAVEQATVCRVRQLRRRIDRMHALHNGMRAAADPPAAGDGAPGQDRFLEEAVDAGLAVLDKLLDLTHGAAGAAEDVRTHDNKAASARAALTTAAGHIHAVGELTEVGLDEITAQGDAVVGRLEFHRTRLNLREDIGEALTRSAADAASLAQDAFLPDECLPDALTDTLAGLCGRYTMAAERDTHRSFLIAMKLADDDMPAPSLAADAILF